MNRNNDERNLADPDELTYDSAAVKVFKDMDLPGMLRSTGFSIFQVSAKAHVSRAVAFRIMGKGAGADGEWASGLKLLTVAKLLAVCGKKLVVGVEDLGPDEPGEPLYLFHQKYFMITPAMGPVAISGASTNGTVFNKHTNGTGKVMKVTAEFETVANAYFAQKLLPRYWPLAAKKKNLTRLLTLIRQSPAEWKVKQFSPGFAMRLAYTSLFTETPEILEILRGTGSRELRWECTGKKHEQYHELGACGKCGVSGNLAGQVLMEIREEL